MLAFNLCFPRSVWEDAPRGARSSFTINNRMQNSKRSERTGRDITKPTKIKSKHGLCSVLVFDWCSFFSPGVLLSSCFSGPGLVNSGIPEDWGAAGGEAKDWQSTGFMEISRPACVPAGISRLARNWWLALIICSVFCPYKFFG